MEKICDECGQKLFGRADKKFCNDQCRTAYHNKQCGVDNDQVRNVNNILRRNRRILAELSANGTTEIRSVILTKLGFDFRHFTSIRKNRSGLAEHFCYDLGYVPVSNGVYLLKSG